MIITYIAYVIWAMETTWAHQELKHSITFNGFDTRALEAVEHCRSDEKELGEIDKRGWWWPKIVVWPQLESVFHESIFQAALEKCTVDKDHKIIPAFDWFASSNMITWLFL